MKSILYFTILWLVFFLLSYVGLSFVGLVPAEVDEFNYRLIESTKNIFKSAVSSSTALTKEASSEEVFSSSQIPGLKENILPEEVIIEKIGVKAPIENPETREISVLDEALQSGVVRFPGSGGLDDDSNIFLFGHSTTFEIVKNEAYKSLNHLEKLQIGDEIILVAGDYEYVYEVMSVTKADKDDALVELSLGEKKLTISTCDTFLGAKDDRIVAEARFINTRLK